MYKSLLIEYANPNNLDDSIVVPFKLQDHSFIHKWIECVELAQQQYPIDNPDRFYGFGSIEIQQQNALARINNTIDIINSHGKIIDKHLTQLDDQDTLNYLHHIFEVYHGLLDSQVHPFYVSAPQQVKQALADLNIDVHRCESIYKGADPRHVVTWYGLPKTKKLNITDYKLFSDEWTFGTVMLNYVEIGKTLEDLANDNDQYIADEAFRPFNHYSADFSVKFWNTDILQINEKRAKINAYYDAHKDFFGPWQLCFVNGTIPLANIDCDLDLKDIEHRQYVKSVNFK